MSDHPLANAKPCGDRVIVRRDQPEKRTAGGIHLPETGTKKQQLGTIVAVGPGMYLNAVGVDGEPKLLPMRLKANDRVVIPGYGGEQMSRAGAKAAEEDEYVILREHEVLAVL